MFLSEYYEDNIISFSETFVTNEKSVNGQQEISFSSGGFYDFLSFKKYIHCVIQYGDKVNNITLFFMW